MRVGLLFTLALILGTTFWTPSADAKRVAAAAIAPITQGEHRYYYERVNTESGYGVSILCNDARTGNILWKTMIYDKAVDAALEHDVQDIWLKSLSLNEGRLIAEDEQGIIYQLDAATGKLLVPEVAQHY